MATTANQTALEYPSPDERYRVLLYGDESWAQLQHGLRDVVIVRRGSGRAELIDAVKHSRPDLVVLDAAAIEDEVLPDLRIAGRQVKFLVAGDPRRLLTAGIVHAPGFAGCLSRSTVHEHLSGAIAMIASGGFFMDHRCVGNLMSAYRELDAAFRARIRETLTPQDRRIVALVANGHTNREIGKEIGVSEVTARNRVSWLSLMAGVSGRVQLAAWAGKMGLAELVTDDG